MEPQVFTYRVIVDEGSATGDGWLAFVREEVGTTRVLDVFDVAGAESGVWVAFDWADGLPECGRMPVGASRARLGMHLKELFRSIRKQREARDAA